MGTRSDAVAPPFLRKVYHIVDDNETDDIISWTDGGKHFTIHDMNEFAAEILPKYFKHNNFSSFVRQLNSYGFYKVKHTCWTFSNSNFVKGQEENLVKIRRRANVRYKPNEQEAPESGLMLEAMDKRSRLVEMHLRQELKITKLEMAHLTHRVNTVEQIQEQLLALFVNPNPQTALSQSGVPSAPHAVVPGLGGPTSNNASENRNTVNDTLQSIYAQMRESRRVAEVAAYTLANEVGVNGTGGAGLLGVAGPNLGGGGHGLLGGLSNIYDVRGAAHLEAMYQQQQQQQQQQHQHQHQHQHHQQANAVAPPDGRAQMAFGQGAEGIGLDRNNTGLF